MTYKVGDKVRIVRDDSRCTYGSHGYDLGHVGVITEYVSDGMFRVGPKAMGNWCGADDVEPVTSIQVGETYTGNGCNWECLFVRGNIAWMTSGDAAYCWDATTGKSLCLGASYDIDLTPKPVLKTVEWECHWDSDSCILHNFEGHDPHEHNVKITFDTLGGVPQWDTIKADGA